MRSLMSYKGEEALELLADIIEPAASIIADKTCVTKFRANKLSGAAYIIKKHKKDALQIMARLEGKSVKDFKNDCNLLTLPTQILAILNDKELLDFFNSSLGTSTEDLIGPSGSVTESTEETEE